jgi:hypothetical protein
MQYGVHRANSAWHKFRVFFTEEFIALLLVVFVLVAPAGAQERFANRSLFMNSVTPGATTSWVVSLDYATQEAVGSLDMYFCESPIPYDPCVKPAGLDITSAILAEQLGETGFSITNHTDKRITLSRTSTMTASPGVKAKYTFNNIVNPTDTSKAFSIRMTSHVANDATGPHINFGSVRGQVGDGISIETQVPPMLIFCIAEMVNDNCQGTNENYFTDMGGLSSEDTLTAQSQFAVGTNASAGFAVTVSGGPLTAGTNVIDGIELPSASQAGRNQFGINLVENDELGVGHDPEGTWLNAVPSSDYAQPNVFKYAQGDVIAYSPNVSLIKKFTVSYVVNVSQSLPPGVYTTTINYVASGRF